MSRELPLITLQRMPVYLNYLKAMPASTKYVSSGHIAEDLGLGEVLVRKDLAFTNAVGKPRVGYVTEELIAAIEEVLCYNGKRPAVIIGYGALGKAILGYGGFGYYGIDIISAFDSDEKKVGQSPFGKPVHHISEAAQEIKKLGVKLAIICTPVQSAQEVANLLVSSGVKAILNFAPANLKTPEGVEVRQIDVAANLAILSSGIK